MSIMSKRQANGKCQFVPKRYIFVAVLLWSDNFVFLNWYSTISLSNFKVSLAIYDE